MRYDRNIQTNRVRIVRNIIIIIHSMSELAAYREQMVHDWSSTTL